MVDYILATHNLKKREEMQRILSPIGINVLLAEEVGIELSDAEETGTTFIENAKIKAESGCRESGYPCIADDSGLSVDALGGAPGVYSARYSGGHGNDEENNQKLLRELKDIPDEKRSAAYKCAICCCYPDGRVIFSEGSCSGRIGYEPKGNGGFGYDPYFLPEEYGFCKTMAELTADEKDVISHRGKALRELVKIMENINDK